MKKSTVLAAWTLGAMFIFSPCLAVAQDLEPEEGAPMYETAPDIFPRADWLLMENAVGALWYDDVTKEKMKEEGFAGIDLNSIKAAAPHVFAHTVQEYYENGVRTFEGQVFRMGTRQDGIEYIADKDTYLINVVKGDNGYRVVGIRYIEEE